MNLLGNELGCKEHAGQAGMGEEGGHAPSDGVSGLELHVETGVQVPVRACFPQADGISHAAVSPKRLHHPVYSKIKKNEWVTHSLGVGMQNGAALWKTIWQLLKKFHLNLP